MNIYEKFNNATQSIRAYALLQNDTNFIGKIVFVRKPNAMRLTCFFHLHSDCMVFGIAGGWGYDKHTAAFSNALEKYFKDNPESQYKQLISDLQAVKNIDSIGWDSALRAAGISAACVV